MKPDIKVRWERHLREMDNSLQCFGHLAEPNGKRCAAGVLVDLAVEDGITEYQQYPYSLAGTKLLAVKRSDNFNGYWISHLPYEVREWAEVKRGNPRINHNDIIELNDLKRLTFKQIAALLHKTKASEIK